jgi:hypothetical protein
MPKKGKGVELAVVSPSGVVPLKQLGEKKKKKKKKKSGDGGKAMAVTTSKYAVTNVMQHGKRLLAKYGQGKHRIGKVSGKKELAEFQKDADAYVDNLIAPELHIPAKQPDNSLVESVLTHTEFSDFAQMISNLTYDGAHGYAGIAIFPRLKNCIAKISAVSNAGAFTWTFTDHPQYATFAANFLRTRAGSISLVGYDPTLVLNRNGLYAVNRVQQMNNFTPNSALPTGWAQFVASPGTEVLTNSSDFSGVRVTYLPNAISGNAEEQYQDISDGTTQNGTVLIILMQVATNNISGAPLGSNGPTVRVYANMEAVPFQDTAVIFDPSVQLGDPVDLTKSILKASDFLVKMGSTISGFEQFLESKDANLIWNTTKSGLNYLKGLFFGASPSTVRIYGYLDAALSSVENASDLEPTLRLRLRSTLTELLQLTRTSDSDSISDVVSVKQMAVPLPKPITLHR